MDVRKVQFSGGEPLLMRGFLELVDAIDTESVRVHIATNGYALSEAIVTRLAGAGVRKLSVSVDGGTAEHHDRIRRKAGAFDRALAGIERAAGAGISVGVSSTVTPANFDSMSILVERLIVLGAHDVSFHSVVAVGRATIHPELMFIGGQAPAFRAEVSRLKAEFGTRIGIDHSFSADRTRAATGCPAQQKLLHIDPSGDLSSCSWLYKIDPAAFTLGNIGHESLADIVDRRCRRLQELRTLDGQHCLIPLAEKLGPPA